MKFEAYVKFKTLEVNPTSTFMVFDSEQSPVKQIGDKFPSASQIEILEFVPLTSNMKLEVSL